MCGRYTLRHDTEEIALRFAVDAVALDAALRRPRFNIAPTQEVPVVFPRAPQDGGGRVLGAARWGLVPSWARDPSIGNKLLNARAETVAEKPSFRVALQRRRCLIPADGFYEWRAGAGARGPRQPYFIHLRRPLREGELFAFAGLWEEWRPGDGSAPLRTCTIITVPPNRLMATLHDRMPAILRPRDEARWLSPQAERAELLALLRPYADGDGDDGARGEHDDAADGSLQADPVSRKVNRAGHDAPDCLAPPDPALPPGGTPWI